MKVIFDTNVYVSFIRNRAHSQELQMRGSVKYLSAIVLMELWAGAKIKQAERLVYQLQKPYQAAGRIITLNLEHYISIGHFFSEIAPKYRQLAVKSSFLNDVQIAFTALSVGAVLFTEDKTHYDIIRKSLKSLKLEYLQP